MKTTIWVCALASSVAGFALADVVNVICQHNGYYDDPNNPGWPFYEIVARHVVIYRGVEEQTFLFEATLEENGQYQAPGDIDSIVAVDNAGPVALTVVGHNGHPYGARDIGTIQLHNTGVSGSIRSLMLSRNLATLDTVTAAELSGQCELGDLGDSRTGLIVAWASQQGDSPTGAPCLSPESPRTPPRAC